jgi:O-antigen/teichoic acid export membrane protein
MLLFPQILLGFFGSEFVKGASVLRILAIGQFVNAVTGPVGLILLMTNKERHFALSMAVISGVNVLGNFLVIPVMGIVGAALVTTTSVALLNSWQFMLSRNSV